MFIVNGEILHEKTHKKEYEWMQKKFEEIRAMGKEAFTFAAFNKRGTVLRDDGRVVPMKQRRRLVSLVGRTDEPTGITQSWAYASSINSTKTDGNIVSLVRSTFPMEYNMIFLVKDDIELIFYFMYLSQNRNVKIVDYELRNRQEAEAIALRSKAESLIYSLDSPIHPSIVGSDQPLKNIALAWGITNSFEMDVYTLMKALWTKVQNDHANGSINRGYAEFIAEVEKQGDAGKRASVVLAIQKNILQYDANVWKMITKGGAEQFLCGVPLQDEANRDEYVIKYLLNNDLLFEAMELAAKSGYIPPPPPEEKIEEPKLEDLPRHRLLVMAKEDLGWSGEHYKTISAMKKPELLDLVQNERRPEDN